MSSRPGERLICTVLTKAYVAEARVLARALAEHSPDATLHVLLADRVDGFFDPAEEPFEVIELAELTSEREREPVRRMCFYYRPFELCCALRGLLHRWVIERTDAERWLFLDADLLVLDSLEPIWRRLDHAPILLSPHLLRPVDGGDLRLEQLHLRYGIYNGGFLGLRRSDATERFARWLSERLARHAFDQPGHGQFVDQRWLDWVPVFFPESARIEDPGFNVAYWNLHERPLGRDGDRFIAGNAPLRAFHFSGWSHRSPERLTRRNPDHRRADDPLWIELAERYRALLLDAGIEQTREWPYAFAHFTDGRPILDTMRREYFHDLEEGTADAGSPFDEAHTFYGRHNALSRRLRRAGARVLKRLRRAP